MATQLTTRCEYSNQDAWLSRSVPGKGIYFGSSTVWLSAAIRPFASFTTTRTR